MKYRLASSAAIVLAGFGKAPVSAATGPIASSFNCGIAAAPKVAGEDHGLLGTIEQNRTSRPADLGNRVSTLSRGAA